MYNTEKFGEIYRKKEGTNQNIRHTFHLSICVLMIDKELTERTNEFFIAQTLCFKEEIINKK